MKIDLLGGSYQQKYIEFNAQRTINWYQVVTTQNEKSKSTTALFPFPGLTTYVTLPGRYLRGIFTARTNDMQRCFAVCDNILYEINSNYTYTTRGTMSSMSVGSTKVHMCVDA